VVFSQESRSELLTSLNNDVWIPYLTGVNNNKPELYNSVNSNDFYWVRSGNEKTRIMNLKEYVEDSGKVMDSRAAKGVKTELDVRFIERNINGEFASEKCIFRFTSIEPGQEPVTSYGISHIFSRKENGTWKKLIQCAYTDATSEEAFSKAQPLIVP
jgi:hypothetical protein